MPSLLAFLINLQTLHIFTFNLSVVCAVSIVFTLVYFCIFNHYNNLLVFLIYLNNYFRK
jgi:hypothetical protein